MRKFLKIKVYDYYLFHFRIHVSLFLLTHRYRNMTYMIYHRSHSYGINLQYILISFKLFVTENSQLCHVRSQIYIPCGAASISMWPIKQKQCVPSIRNLTYPLHSLFSLTCLSTDELNNFISLLIKLLFSHNTTSFFRTEILSHTYVLIIFQK